MFDPLEVRHGGKRLPSVSSMRVRTNVTIHSAATMTFRDVETRHPDCISRCGHSCGRFGCRRSLDFPPSFLLFTLSGSTSRLFIRSGRCQGLNLGTCSPLHLRASLSRPRLRAVLLATPLSGRWSLHATGRQIHSKCLAPLPNSRCCLHSRSPSTPIQPPLRCCCQPAPLRSKWFAHPHLHVGCVMLRS